MATTYTKTDNYGLNLYGDNDPADLRDGYNGSMRTIDDTLGKHLNRIESMESRETHDEEVAKALLGDNTVDAATASKTKWNKAATDAASATDLANTANNTASAANNTAAANGSILNALGADTVDNATATKTKWDKAATNATQALDGVATNNSNIEKANKRIDATESRLTILETVPPENIVIIGDSISYGTGASELSKSWANMLATYRGCTVTNLAKNDAGYVNGGNASFINQAKGYSGDRSKVTHVIVAGGANDKTHIDGNALTDAINGLFEYLHTSFPKAKIIAVPCVLGFLPASRYHANIWTVINRIVESAGKNGVQVIPYGWEWLAGNSNWSADFSIHPNDAGNQILLENITNGIDGGVVRAEWSSVVSGADNHATIVNGLMRVSQGVAYFTAQAKVINDHSAYNDFIQLPYVMTQAGGNYFVANSKNVIVYAHPDNTNHSCRLGCTTSIANNTEIYLTASKPVDA